MEESKPAIWNPDKALEHRRRTYEELVREFTEDPKDEEFSIDELLLTIDELQKEEQKNT